MSSSPSMQIANSKSVAQAAVPADAARRNEVTSGNLATSPQIGPKRVGYGLPCSKCKTYYAANLSSCPVCKHGERVSPKAINMPGAAPSITPTGDAVALEPEDAALEQEREKFLREFKSQIYAAHTQINAAASFRCSKEENHQGEFEPAAVCQGCYDHLRERVDLMEAAMHMEIKDAAQIIYDAVWSDPSDPSKTYQNAGQALLTELRKRAGISVVMGSNQPLPH
jgi:hypothetical protein